MDIGGSQTRCLKNPKSSNFGKISYHVFQKMRGRKISKFRSGSIFNTEKHDKKIFRNSNFSDFFGIKSEIHLEFLETRSRLTKIVFKDEIELKIGIFQSTLTNRVPMTSHRLILNLVQIRQWLKFVWDHSNLVIFEFLSFESCLLDPFADPCMSIFVLIFVLKNLRVENVVWRRSD